MLSSSSSGYSLRCCSKCIKDRVYALHAKDALARRIWGIFFKQLLIAIRSLLGSVFFAEIEIKLP